MSFPDSPASHSVHRQVELSFDDLSAFEIVQSQYSAWGVFFDRAIAVQPNNASFCTDRMGIMPTGNPMQMTIAFELPPRRVRLLLTGASLIHASLQTADHRSLNPSLIKRLPLLPGTDRAASDSAQLTAFPQYELDFSTADFSTANYPNKGGAIAQSNDANDAQLHQIRLQSTSPFMLQQLAIETED